MHSALMVFLLTVLAAGPLLAGAVVPVRAIRSQTILAAADLTLSEDPVPPGGIAAIADAVGREARVTLYAGRPVLANQLGAPAMVDRNQIVRMSFARGALAITDEGRALDRGGSGEMVRVMNLNSKQIVTGTVKPDGSIEVGQ